jgi:hypothetical protein
MCGYTPGCAGHQAACQAVRVVRKLAGLPATSPIFISTGYHSYITLHRHTSSRMSRCTPQQTFMRQIWPLEASGFGIFRESTHCHSHANHPVTNVHEPCQNASSTSSTSSTLADLEKHAGTPYSCRRPNKAWLHTLHSVLTGKDI